MRVYKFQLKPTKEQENKLNQTLSICRFTYNQLLEELNINNQRSHIQHHIVELKKQYPNLEQVYSKTLQYECYRLFSNLKGLSQSKKKGNKIGKLRFKGARWFKTIVFNQSGYKLFERDKHYNILHLSRIGNIKLRQHREIEGNIKGIIIKKKVRCWEAHIITDAKYIIGSGDDIIGIDMGVLSFITTSNDEKIDNPLFMNKNLVKLQHLQRKISKTKKGSKNRKKSCLQLQRCWEKIDNQKSDFFHKVSTKLVNQSRFISVECLNIQQMVSKNKYWNNRNILDSSWGRFLQMLKFKAESAGIRYVEVEPKNTSKKCSNCGNLKDMPLNIRLYECGCGLKLDRDYNASLNILGKGLAFAGEDWLQSSMKQEALCESVG